MSRCVPLKVSCSQRSSPGKSNLGSRGLGFTLHKTTSQKKRRGNKFFDVHCLSSSEIASMAA